MTISPVTLWRRQKEVSVLIGKKGKILLWTIIRVPAKSFGKQAPYPVVIVDFGKGEKMTLQLVDYTEKDLQVGKSVITVLRRSRVEDAEEIISYNIKCKPL